MTVQLKVGQVWKLNDNDCTYRITRIDGKKSYAVANVDGVETSEILFKYIGSNIDDNDLHKRFTLLDPIAAGQVGKRSKIEVGQVWKDIRFVGSSPYTVAKVQDGSAYYINGFGQECVFCDVNSYGFSRVDFEKHWQLCGAIDVDKEEVKPVVDKSIPEVETFKIAVGQVWSDDTEDNIWRVTKVTGTDSYATFSATKAEVFFVSVDSNGIARNEELRKSWKRMPAMEEELKTKAAVKPATEKPKNKIKVGQVWRSPIINNASISWRITRIENGSAHGVDMKYPNSHEGSYCRVDSDGYDIDGMKWELITDAPSFQPVVKVRDEETKTPKKIEVGQVWKSTPKLIGVSPRTYRITRISSGYSYGKMTLEGQAEVNNEGTFVAVDGNGFSHTDFSHTDISQYWDLVPTIEEKPAKAQDIKNNNFKIEVGQVWQYKKNISISPWRVTKIVGKHAYGNTIHKDGTESIGGLFCALLPDGTANDTALRKEWDLMPADEVKPAEEVSTKNNNFKMEVGQVWTASHMKSTWRVTRVDGKTVYGVVMTNGKDGRESQFVSIHPDGTVNDNAFRASWRLLLDVVKTEETKPVNAGVKIEVGQLWKEKDSNITYRITKVEGGRSFGTTLIFGTNGEYGFFDVDKDGYSKTVSGRFSLIDPTITKNDIPSKVDEVKAVKIAATNGTKIEVGQLWQLNGSSSYRITKVDSSFCYGISPADGITAKEMAVFFAKDGCVSGNYSNWELIEAAPAKTKEEVSPAGITVVPGQVWQSKNKKYPDQKFRIDKIEGPKIYAFYRTNKASEQFGTVKDDGTADWNTDHWNVTPPPLVETSAPQTFTKFEVGQIFTCRRRSPENSWSYRISRIAGNVVYGFESVKGIETTIEKVFTYKSSDKYFEDCKPNWDITMPGVKEITTPEPIPEVKPAETEPVKNNNYKIEVGQIWKTNSRRELITRIDGNKAYSRAISSTGETSGSEIVLVKLEANGITNDNGLRMQWSLEPAVKKVFVKDVKNNDYKIEIGQVWFVSARPTARFLVTKIYNGQVYVNCLDSENKKTKSEHAFFAIRPDGITDDSGIRDLYTLEPSLWKDPEVKAEVKPVGIKVEPGQVWRLKGDVGETYLIDKVVGTNVYAIFGDEEKSKIFGSLNADGTPEWSLTDWEIVPPAVEYGVIEAPKTKTKIEIGQVWKGNSSGNVFRVTKIEGGMSYCIQIIDRKEVGTEHTFINVDSDGYSVVSGFSAVDPKTVMPTMEKIKLEVGNVLTLRSDKNISWRITRIDSNNGDIYGVKTFLGKDDSIELLFNTGPIHNIEAFKKDWEINIPTVNKLKAGQVWYGKVGSPQAGQTLYITKVSDIYTNFKQVGGKNPGIELSFWGTYESDCTDWELIGTQDKIEDVTKTRTQIKVGQTWKGKAGTWAAGSTYHITKLDGAYSFANLNNSGVEHQFYRIDKDGFIYNEDKTDILVWELIETPAIKSKFKVEVGQVWTRKSDKEVYTITEIVPGQSYADCGVRKRVNFSFLDKNGNHVSENILDRWDVIPAPVKTHRWYDGFVKIKFEVGQVWHSKNIKLDTYTITKIENGWVFARPGGAGKEFEFVKIDSNGFAISDIEIYWDVTAVPVDPTKPVMTTDIYNKAISEEEFNKKMNIAATPIMTINTLGAEVWTFNGKYHKEDGPAITWKDGSTFWYKDGNRHREDGPAIIMANGTKEWWIDGKHITQEEFNKKANLSKEEDFKIESPLMWQKVAATATFGIAGAIASNTIANVAPVKDGRYINQKIKVGQVWTDGTESYRITDIRSRDKSTNATDRVSYAVVVKSSYKRAGENSTFVRVDKDNFTNLLPSTWKLETIKPKENEIVATREKMKVGQIYSDSYGEVYRITALSKRKGIYDPRESWSARGIKIEGFGVTIEKECDFVYMNEACEPDLFNSAWKLVKDSTPTFVEQVKGDLEAAGYRVASTQFTAAIKGAILLLFKDKGYDEGKLAVVKEVLESEFGTAIVSTVLGYGLTYMPSLKNDPRVVKLAGEFRVSGMATVGNEVFGMGMQYVMPALTTALKALPAVEIKKAVKKPAKKKRIAVAPVVDQDHGDTEDKRIMIH